MRIRACVLVLLVGVSLPACGGDDAASVTVMSRNLYLGADLRTVLDAEEGANIIDLINETWATIVASDFPARAEAIADEIADAEVDLVGLQEVMRYERDVGGGIDFAQLVIDALADRGLQYELAVEQDQFGGPFPTSQGTVLLRDRDAILVRTGGEVTITDSSSGQFDAALEVPNPLGGTLRIVRGWTAVDASVGGVAFRFVNTHLEAFGSEARTAQGLELLAGPADTDLPVILVGDLNSPAPDGPTYESMLDSGGFADAWVEADGDGFTCCWPGDLRTAGELDERIDLVLHRGGFTTSDVDVVGDEPDARVETSQTPPGPLWPSDHAGVVATLEVP